jgi:hypothetical protein
MTSEQETGQRIRYEIAEIYAQLLTPIPGEAWKDTAHRMREAIGAKIDRRVFKIAVEIVRNERQADEQDE